MHIDDIPRPWKRSHVIKFANLERAEVYVMLCKYGYALTAREYAEAQEMGRVRPDWELDQGKWRYRGRLPEVCGVRPEFWGELVAPPTFNEPALIFPPDEEVPKP